MRLLSILILTLSLRAADPILQQHFDQGTEGWIANGAGTLTAADGVLTYRYQSGVAALPAKQLPFAEMKSLRFEVRTDSAFAVALVLSEKKPGGSSHPAVIWSNGGSWQPVVLTPTDFAPDLSRIETIALIDFTQYLLPQQRNPQVCTEPHTGEHTIAIRNFEILRDPPVQTAHPQSEWMSLCSSVFESSAGTVTIRYTRRDDLWSAFTRLEALPAVERPNRLALDIQSAHDVQLAISINDGNARHNVDFFVPAGTKLEHREVLLEAFQPAGLNPATFASITILDVTGEPGSNELKMANLAFTRR